jgi:hypothetical protein
VNISICCSFRQSDTKVTIHSGRFETKLSYRDRFTGTGGLGQWTYMDPPIASN